MDCVTNRIRFRSKELIEFFLSDVFEPNFRSASQLNSFEKKGSSNCQTKSTEDTLPHVTNFLSFSVFFSKTDWQLISEDWQSRCLCCWRSLPLRLSSCLRKRHKTNTPSWRRQKRLRHCYLRNPKEKVSRRFNRDVFSENTEGLICLARVSQECQWLKMELECEREDCVKIAEI